MLFKVFEEGVDWSWEMFLDYLDCICNGLFVNVVFFVGYFLICFWVMDDVVLECIVLDEEIF